MFQTEKIANVKALRCKYVWRIATGPMWLVQLGKGREGGHKVKDQCGKGGG